jgi:hypothetical protein
MRLTESRSPAAKQIRGEVEHNRAPARAGTAVAKQNVPSPDWGLWAIGIALAGGGFFLALVGLGLARSPSHLNGPNWLGFAAGLVFFAAGLSVLVRAWLRVPDKQANLPDDAPAVAVAIQWLAALTAIVALATIGTWVAFGADTRQFSMSLPVWGSLAETIGRAAFGFGAIIAWLMAALVAYAGVKKVFGKKS